MKRAIVGFCITLTALGCESGIRSEDGLPTGTWENYGYNGGLQFTLTSRITFRRSGTFTARELFRPTEGAEGWVRILVPEKSKEASATYRGEWSAESNTLTLTFSERRLYLDGKEIKDPADLPDGHFWRISDAGKDPDEICHISFEMIEDGLLFLSYTGDRNDSPFYALFFSESASALFARD